MRKITSLMLVGLMVLGGFLGLLSLSSENAEAQLADTPWPCFQGNAKHTGLSPYDTSGVDGTLKWSYNIEDPISSSPAIGNDGTIYIGSCVNPSNNGKLYAINPSGTPKWSYHIGDAMYSSPAVGSDGTVYVGSNDDKLYAINPSGTLKWSYTTGGTVKSSPTIGSDGTVYVGSNDGKLYAINPSGTLKWSYTTGDVNSSPAIGSDGTIYVGSIDLFSINPDGTLEWSYPTGPISSSGPTIGTDGTIYVGSVDDDLYAINPSGTLKWSYNTGGSVQSSPAIGSDGRVYVGSNNNRLCAISDSGTLEWSYNTGGNVKSSPAIGSDGTVYVGSWSDSVFALGSANIPSAPINLEATPGDAIISLSWSAPTSDGGSSITNYKIYRGTSSGGETLLTTIGNSLSYTDSPVTNGQTYYYRVAAVNSIGEGTQSNEVSATPTATTTVPNVPQNLQATPGDGQIILYWSAPTSNGGASITNYKIYGGTSSGGETLLTTIGNSLSYTDSPVTNGQTYYYKVSAVNSVGEGAQSSEVSATPSSVSTLPDSDSDELPDSWEQTYFDDLSETANGDYDGDGSTNLEEYDGNTNPTNPDDYPGANNNGNDENIFTEPWFLGLIASLIIMGIVVVALLIKNKGVKSTPPLQQQYNQPIQQSHPSSQTDISERLDKLNELKDKGLITEGEFQIKKQELLKDL